VLIHSNFLSLQPLIFFRFNIILTTIEELVSEKHSSIMINECMYFIFIEDEVENIYSEFERAIILPVAIFKLLIINKIFEINLMRKICEE